MSGTIHLGYEVGTGKPVAIPLRHTAVTGQTQESGKTTTLEGLITRSKLRGLAYITKRGESSFHVKKSIPPYFRERTDWQFVAAILEATMSERLKFQRSWIMKLCEARHAKNENWAAPRTLGDVMRNTDSALEKAHGMNESVYYELREYLRLVVPQIDRLPYSTRLEMVPGVNVMDLTAYEFPMKALVVRSCIEWIRAHERDTINVIPEAWKFAPKQRNSPVRLAAEEYIREGAALRNFLWLDSQDIAGVADVLLRQIGVWIFGVQRAKHEIERTLDHIPEGLLARRPRAGDVATLGKGQFFVCFGREMYKVYVQPAWMKAAHAEAIARGEEPVESAKQVLEDYEEEHPDGAGRTGTEEGKVKTDYEHTMLTARDRIAAIRNFVELDQKANGKPSDVIGSDFAFMLAQYDAVVAAHDALAERVRALEAVIPDPILRVLPSPAAPNPSSKPVSVEADTGAESRSGPAPVTTKGPLSTDGNREARPNPGAEFKPAALSPLNHDALVEDLYRRIKERAVMEKDPAILRLFTTQPELRVTIKRQTIEADGGTVFGGLAHLISKGFFDSPTSARASIKELRRLGYSFKDATVGARLAELCGMGFLTREAKGDYQSVPSMKVHIEEAGPAGASGGRAAVAR